MATGTGPDVRRYASGGRHAEQPTHATRHGEHALQPKHVHRQAQLRGIQAPGGLAGREPQSFDEKSLHKMSSFVVDELVELVVACFSGLAV